MVTYLRDVDPVDRDSLPGDIEDFNTSSFRGLCHDNSLPVPLRADADQRLERRFDAALQTINEEIKFKANKLDVEDDFAAAALVADRTIQRTALLSRALSSNQLLRDEAEDQFEEVIDTVLGEAGL